MKLTQHTLLARRGTAVIPTRPGLIAAAISVSLLLAGCSSSSSFDFDSAIEEAAGRVAPGAAFNPAEGVFPFPNNLLFAGTEDRTLNIPVTDPADLSNPQVALNSVDGFSTTEAITAPFNQPLDPATLVVQETIHVFEIAADPLTLTPQGINRELTAAEIIATPVGDGTTLALIPTQPLPEQTSFMVLVTNGVADTQGRNVGRAALFDLAVEENDSIDPMGPAGALIPLGQLAGGLIQLGAAAGINPDDVVMAWNFTTQSTTPVMQAVRAAAVPSQIAVQPNGLNTGDFGALGAADISVGFIALPYYLEAPTLENPLGAVNGFWRGQGGSNLTAFNPQPVATSTLNVPVLMTVPNANSGMTMPDAGWPVAIFQHGITADRSNVIAIADSMAAAGFAVIGIDLPLHGITDTSSPLYMEGMERTFDLDLSNNESGAPGPDGQIDGSGSLFVNLTNLQNARDNFRQGVADLFTLSASVGSLPMIDGSRKAFIGHSLGAIVGSTALAFDNTFSSATLANGGSGIARLFAGSPTFGPTVEAGLGAAGIELASAQGQQFLNATQTVIDSADPANHAAATAANAPIHLIQVLGDQVITGTVPGAPFSATEPHANLLGLPIVSSTSSGSGWVRFTGGTHSSVLDPGPDMAVTVEMQTQIATFAASAGQLLQIDNPGLLEAAP